MRLLSLVSLLISISSFTRAYGQNLIMHLDADQYVTSPNGLVTKWKFANDTNSFCEQLSLTYAPSKVSNDGGLHGHNSVRFATGTSGIKLLTFPNISLNNGTVVLVASQDLIDNQMRYFVSGTVNSAYQGGLWLGGTQSNITGFGWESSPPSTVRQSNTEPIGWQVYTFSANKLYLNGVETGYTFSQNTATALLNTLGGVNLTALLGTHFLKGKIAEMFVYDYNIPPAQVTQKSDSLINEYFPHFTLGPDTLVCGASYTLQPRQGVYYNSYLWSNGQTTREITISTNGTYWLQGRSFGRTFSDTITVTGLAPKPVITPLLDQTICLNRDTVTFSRVGGLPTLTYTWNTGETDPSVQVTAGGPVFLNALDPVTGCLTQSDTVLLINKTKADFDNSAVCPGVDALFQNLSVDLTNDTVAAWAWNFGDPGTAADTSTDTNGVWNYAQSGTYSVYLKVVTTDGCADSIAKNVTVKPTATANFNWQGACYGKPTQFFDQSIPEGGTQVTGYQWFFGPGISSSFVNPAVTFDTANVYPVTLVAYTASGCTDTVQLQVPVNKGVDAAFSISDSLCAGQPVNALDESQGISDNITQWIWRFGNNPPISGQTPQFAFQGTGNRVVRLTTTTAAGCADSVQKTVFVRPSPTAAFSFAANGGTPPFTPVLNNQSSGADFTVWDYGNGFTDIAVTPVLPPFADTGTYTVTLAVANSEGCTDTVSHAFVVFTGDRTLQLMQATCVLDDDGFVNYTARVLNKGALEVNGITFGGNLNYNSVLREKWEGTLLSGQVMEYVFNSSAKYFTSADFCCVRIENFNDTLTVQAPDNEICKPLTDQAWFSDAYPTPTDGIITIDHTLPFADVLSATLCSVDGKIIRPLFNEQSAAAGFGSHTADISDLRSGLYVVRFTYRDKNYSVKVLKK